MDATRIISPTTDPKFWTLCRPGRCGCMYGECERIHAQGGTDHGYFQPNEKGVLGINDTGPQ